MLMTGFVLLNDMKAEASWALLGLTCRLAQSLGLHRSAHIDSRSSPDTIKKEMSRRKLWYFLFPAPRSIPSVNWTATDMQTGGHAYGTTL